MIIRFILLEIGGNQDPERWTDSPKRTTLLSGRAKIWTQFFEGMTKVCFSFVVIRPRKARLGMEERRNEQEHLRVILNEGKDGSPWERVDPGLRADTHPTTAEEISFFPGFPKAATLKHNALLIFNPKAKMLKQNYGFFWTDRDSQSLRDLCVIDDSVFAPAFTHAI